MQCLRRRNHDWKGRRHRERLRRWARRGHTSGSSGTTSPIADSSADADTGSADAGCRALCAEHAAHRITTGDSADPDVGTLAALCARQSAARTSNLGTECPWCSARSVAAVERAASAAGRADSGSTERTNATGFCSGALGALSVVGAPSAVALHQPLPVERP